MQLINLLPGVIIATTAVQATLPALPALPAGPQLPKLPIIQGSSGSTDPTIPAIPTLLKVRAPPLTTGLPTRRDLKPFPLYRNRSAEAPPAVAGLEADLTIDIHEDPKVAARNITNIAARNITDISARNITT